MMDASPMRVPRRLAAALLLTLSLLALIALHPRGRCQELHALPFHAFHYTVAELELSSESKSLECSLAVVPGDLEEAIEKSTGSKFRLDAKGAKRAVARYVGQSFRLLTKGGKCLEQSFVGMQKDGRALWLHFEFPRTQSLKGLTLVHRVLFEVEGRVMHSVTLRTKNGKQRLSFGRQKSKHHFDR